MKFIIATVYIWSLSFTGPVLGQHSNLQDAYTEELVLQGLPNGNLLVMLFIEQSTRSMKHNVRFPAATSTLAKSSVFQSMELHLTQGHWNLEKWGPAPMSVHPHGAELIAWLDPSFLPEEVPNIWKDLTTDFSALFCGSFGSVDASEKVIFTKAGSPPFWNPYSRIAAFLPQEPVCVENLTPWLKLLPCKGKKGLASIFSSQALFQGVFYGMHTRIMKSNEYGALILSQKIEVVFKAHVLKKETKFRNLLSAESFASCPVADSAQLFIHEKLPISLNHPPEQQSSIAGFGNFTHYEINNPLKDYNLTLSGNLDRIVNFEGSRYGFGGQSYLTGSRGNDGTLIIELKFQSPSSSKQIVCLLQPFPWVIRVWFHSLKFKIDGEEVTNIKQKFQHFRVQASDDRKAPSVLDLCMEVASTATIQVQYTKAFLYLEEHPPDAYRGVDIPPALVNVFNKTDFGVETVNWNSSWSIADITPLMLYSQFYIKGSLVRILVPDFSMPYNVCAMTSTVLAFFFCYMIKELTQEGNLEKEEKTRQMRQRVKIIIFIVMVALLGYLYDFSSLISNPTHDQP